jgi:hypothetical protein
VRNIFVLGMHRSGTSAVTGALAANGFYAGERLLPADPGFNDTGFFEHEAVVAIHDEFLAAFELDWRYCYLLPENCFLSDAAMTARTKIGDLLTNEYSLNPPWCIKDPRACLLFPLWRDVLTEQQVDYGIVITHRVPADIAASLQRRDALEINHGLLLWIAHCLATEKFTRGLPRTFIDYQAILENPLESLTEALLKLGIKFSGIGAELGVEQKYNHVGGSKIECPDFIVRAATLLNQRPLPEAQLDQLALELAHSIPLMPKILPLERAAEKWRSDLVLSQDHIRNLQDSLDISQNQNCDLQDSLDISQNQNCDLQDSLDISQNQIRDLQTLLEEERKGFLEADGQNREQARELEVSLAFEREKVEQLDSQLIGLREQHRVSESSLARANESFTAISNSFFWRLTRPARYTVERLRRARRIKTPRSLHQIALKPESQLLLDEGWYVSQGEDPQFLLISDQDHVPEGRVEIQFVLEADSAELEPVMYVNHGFEGSMVEVQLPLCQPGAQKFQLTLPTHTNYLRLDPLTRPGRFSIDDFTIRELY